jgi:branched-chain amino acid transport system ATP-binding protein
VVAYERAMHRFCLRLLQPLALALGLPRDWFAPFFEQPTTFLRLLHYPPHARDADDDAFGSAPHTDYGFITILCQDSQGGLEVRRATARGWPPADRRHLGGQCRRHAVALDHGRWQSTPHRVKNLSGGDRYSCPYFFDMSMDSTVEVLPTCQDKPIRRSGRRCAMATTSWSGWTRTTPIASRRSPWRDTDCSMSPASPSPTTARRQGDVSLSVGAGEIVALLGANGAGKSTTVRMIAGVLAPQKGDIRFAGEVLTGSPSHVVVRRGITLVPEGRLVFPQMTVMENLQLGAHIKQRGEVAGLVEKAFTLFPRLAERRHQLAGSMSGGEQQMLAIARGLMAEPRLIILDEPSLGLMPIVTQEVFRLIEAVNKSGIGVLLVEQNLHQSLRIAHRGYVLEKGAVVLAGHGQELLANDYGPAGVPRALSSYVSSGTTSAPCARS